MNVPLRPLRIGRILIDFPVILASLAGYSDLAYRTICRSCSAPYAATEALLDRFLIADGKLRRRNLMTDAGDRPVAAQLMGIDPEVMAAAAAVVTDTGFDVVDLNFACPVRKVTGRGRGGAFMNRPEQALAVIREVVRAVPKNPVTVKLRRSFLEDDTESSAFWTIARGAFDAGVAAVCVHARSVEAKYRGRADWSFLARVKSAFPDGTVIGSGDVHTAADALDMIRQTGVDGVACARGSIGNPWIFRQARDLAAGFEPHTPSLTEQRTLIERHYALLIDHYGPEFALRRIRNLGIRYSRLHPDSVRLRDAVIAVRTESDRLRVMETFYGV
ncbi:MAG: tRNA-dihydrouridine synthase [Acidobacteriota bacterium]|nr:tRNA-dihydrouridine synthase [Acidobacteriota bacterium]